MNDPGIQEGKHQDARLAPGICAACAFLAVALGACGPDGADLHVSPAGNDAWSGRLAAPNAARTDGPFATLERARDAAREVRGALPAGRSVVVRVRGGTYAMAQPFRLGPQDSGILFEAQQGETPVLSGGRRITGWKKGGGSLWQAELPDVKAGRWFFHQLFVNGERRQPASIPKGGFLRTAGALEPYSKDRKDPAFAKNQEIRSGFKFQSGDLDSSWRNPNDIRLFLYHSWTASLHWVAGIDEGKKTVRFTNRCGWPVGYWEKDQRYRLEHVREGLDAPGEWYLDRGTGVLEYHPLPGEDMAKVEVFAPVLQQLLLVEGDWPKAAPVRDVTFRGIAFHHADWAFTNNTQTVDGQAAVSLPGAVQVRGAERFVLEGCEVAHVGGYAIAIEDGCKSNRVARCHIRDFGAGGVRVGEFVRQRTASRDAKESGTAVPELTHEGTGPRDTSRNAVDNCFIHDGGHVFPAGVGVIIGHSAFNEVTRNEICDLYYSAVSAGWVWGFGKSAAHHNRIADNHLHHIGWGVLSDMGGVYTLGPSEGTVVARNHIHHVSSYSYGGWGLYTDEGSSGIVMEDNVVHDTKSGGFHQHYGRGNIIRNNIFAFSREGQIQRSREDVTNNFTFTHNIVYCDNDQVLIRVWKNGDYKVDNNTYWTTAKGEPLFAGQGWEEWRAASGQDGHSVLADPQFVDAAKRDFRLRPGSPALKAGFKPFDISGAGLRGDAAWTAMPGRVQRAEFVLPPTASPAPSSIDEGFEDTAPGEKAKGAETHGESGDAQIRVTEKAAASGGRSLEFTDAPGLSAAHSPLLQYKPRIAKGVVHASFDLRPEAGAICWNEWRDAASPYHAGPSVRVEANGDVTAGGRKLTAVPRGQWSRFEIDCPLGDATNRTWTLAVTPAGRPAQRFANLPLRSNDFRKLQWFGFISMATTNTSFLIDNVKIEAGAN